MPLYCVKCRQRQFVALPQKVQMKNGKPAYKAPCPACGTGMYRIGEPPAEEVLSAIVSEAMKPDIERETLTRVLQSKI